jgi:hypothetical protein
VAPIIPILGAIGAVAGTAGTLINAFKKPPTAPMPLTALTPATTVAQDAGMTTGMKQALVATTPQGILSGATGSASTNRGRLLGD